MTKVRDEIHKDFYWSGFDYQPKCCLACWYYLLPEGDCTRYCDWVTIAFPDKYKCARWEKRENVYSQQKKR